MTAPIDDLPDALARWDEVRDVLEGRRTAVFLDFDGTLATIVEDPAAARLAEGAREALDRLRACCPVTVMSGRDAEDVRTRVGIDGVIYAGSHGFDVIWPDGRRDQRGTEYRDRLATARDALAEELTAIPGAEIEPKRFAVAVHHRRVDPDHVGAVEAAVARVAARVDGLRRTGGKRVLELRPDLEWDKGRALLWLLEEIGHDEDTVPIYLGDDLTDEDAFAAVRGREAGLAIVVRGEDDRRATQARYAVADVTAAGALLHRLADLLSPPA